MDSIYDSDTTDGNVDRIVLAADIAPSDVTLTRDWDALVLKVNGTNDQLRVSSYFSEYDRNYGRYSQYVGEMGNKVEEIVFSDGTTWSVADVQAMTKDIVGTTGDDYLYGYYGEDNHMYGKEGNDTLYGMWNDDNIYGGLGNDRLDGRGGTDLLEGGLGNDTYVFGRGYGQDTIYDSDTASGNVDTISLGYGIKPDDVTAEHIGNDLRLTVTNPYGGTPDVLTVERFFVAMSRPDDANPYGQYVGDDANKIESVTFYDGTTWSAIDVADKAHTMTGTTGDDQLYGNPYRENVLYGLAGNDYMSAGYVSSKLYGGEGDDQIYGSYGDDYIDGGTGNDVMNGGYSADTYVFSGSFGNDQVNDRYGRDVLQFADADKTSLIFTENEQGLSISVAGHTDSVQHSHWSPYSQWTVEDSSGSTMGAPQLTQLIQAMASWSADNGGVSWSSALETRPQDVETVVSQYWTAPTA
jgi:Ca2+-binding RTX toxin-like protein